MYYDMNRIIEEELSGVNYLLEKLNETDDGEEMQALYVKQKNGQLIYHTRKRIAPGGKRQSVMLGDEKSTEVIRIKQRHFVAELRRTLRKNKEMLERMRGKYLAYDPEAIDERLFPIYRDDTGSVNKNPGMMDDDEWKKQPYRHNPYAMKQEVSITCDGEKVRSKGEVIIYNIYKYLGVPFHYEEDINLVNEAGDHIYKNADYVFRDPLPNALTGKIIHEHLGMLADNEYLEMNVNKIRIYIRNRYTLNNTLFLSADDADGQTDAYTITLLIKNMILPRIGFKPVFWPDVEKRR